MSWDPIWEKVFQEKEWGQYPPEELIRFVARHFYRAPDRSKVRLLELGCGPGACVWYMAREGFDVYAVEGSQTAIDRAKARLEREGLHAHFQVGDVVSVGEAFPANSFDAVVDVGCLQCNRSEAIQRALDQAWQVLKPDGWIFSILLAEGTHGQQTGREIAPNTYTEITEGPLAGLGCNRFFSLEDVQAFFGRFSDLRIEYSQRSFDDRQHFYKSWVMEGRKGL